MNIILIEFTIKCMFTFVEIKCIGTVLFLICERKSYRFPYVFKLENLVKTILYVY